VDARIMAENTAEVIVGGVVLAVAIGFLVFAGRVTGLTNGTASDSYQLNASFRSAEGISVGTDVRLAGVKIGSVSDLALNAQTFRADVSFLLENMVELPDDSSVAISSEGLLGGTFVEIIPGGSPFTLEDGGQIEDTQGAVSLIGLLSKFVTGTAQ
jgi:phospholipid/cholesterol/gamma-HCH transport system substrate-binding protein